jgi:hypothetical protein
MKCVLIYLGYVFKSRYNSFECDIIIYAVKNSNKFQKTRLWKEKSVENVVRLEDLPFNSSMISFHIWLSKKSIHTLQNNIHMLSFPIL